MYPSVSNSKAPWYRKESIEYLNHNAHQQELEAEWGLRENIEKREAEQGVES